MGLGSMPFAALVSRMLWRCDSLDGSRRLSTREIYGKFGTKPLTATDE